MKPHQLLLLGLVLASAAAQTGASAAAQTRVLVVDAARGPGAQYERVEDAVRDAADGDIVLVRAGTYGEDVVIEGKALTLVGAPGAERPVIGGLRVLGAPLAGLVDVRGLTVQLDSSSTVLLQECPGPVWLENVRVELAPTAIFSSPLRIEDSDAVVLTRYTQGPPLQASLPGLSILRSRVQVFESRITAGDARDLLFSHGEWGGDALQVEDSRVLLAGVTLTGGAGSDILSPICALRGGNGGAGLRVVGASRVERQGCTLIGGPAGTSCGQDGLPGAPLVLAGGVVVDVPGPARGCRLEPLAFAGKSTTVVLRGRPGELALLLVSPSAAVASSSPLFQGRLLLGDPLRIPVTGLLPANGELRLTLAIPRFLGPDARRLHAQGLFLDPATGLVLSSPSSLAVLGLQALPATPP